MRKKKSKILIGDNEFGKPWTEICHSEPRGKKSLPLGGTRHRPFLLLAAGSLCRSLLIGIDAGPLMLKALTKSHFSCLPCHFKGKAKERFISLPTVTWKLNRGSCEIAVSPAGRVARHASSVDKTDVRCLKSRSRHFSLRSPRKKRISESGWKVNEEMRPACLSSSQILRSECFPGREAGSGPVPLRVRCRLTRGKSFWQMLKLDLCPLKCIGPSYQHLSAPDVIRQDFNTH